MAVFSYRAESIERKEIVRGTINSESAPLARRALRQQGLAVLTITEIVANQRSAAGSNPGESISEQYRGGHRIQALGDRNWKTPRLRDQARVTNFVGELATLLGVGVPVAESLRTLVPQYRGRFQTRLLQILDSVESGQSLRDSLASQPDLYDELSLSLVEVGENTGKLDESLRCLADFKRRSLEFRDRVLNALLYPAIILLVSGLVSLFLMTVVVPTLLENLTDLGRELPWPTRVLKWLSDTLLAQGWWLASLAGLGSLGAGVLLRTPKGMKVRDEIVFRLPLLGALSRKQEISRISMVIATLIGSGLDLLKAFEITSRTTGNTLLRESLKEV